LKREELKGAAEGVRKMALAEITSSSDWVSIDEELKRRSSKDYDNVVALVGMLGRQDVALNDYRGREIDESRRIELERFDDSSGYVFIDAGPYDEDVPYALIRENLRKELRRQGRKIVSSQWDFTKNILAVHWEKAGGEDD